MNRQEQELRLVIREMISEAGVGGAMAQQAAAGAKKTITKAFEDLVDSDGQYQYRVFPNGALQIIKSPKNPKVSSQNPLTVSTKNPAYRAIVGSLKSMYTNSQTLLSKPFEMIKAAAVGAAKAASDALAPDPNAPVTTDAGLLGKMAGVFGKMSNVLSVADGACNPTTMPLWVWPFINFVALRKTPMVITNDAYCQALQRVCDAAWARGSTKLAGPGDIATAQSADPVWGGSEKQGIVGADISFKKDWSEGYDYTSTNPYMHIAMSLTNFSFTKNGDGTYNFGDKYDFNDPHKVDPPLGDPNHMLQNARARSKIFKTSSDMFMQRGVFAGIEDLMRYYHASLNYPGFEITGKTVMPQNYKPIAARSSAAKPAAKKPAPAAKKPAAPAGGKPAV
jgi:hypothetical protein